MKTVGYYNGQISEVEDLRIPALDRSVYFGDGVYDVAICENRKPFTLDYHIDRFYNSASSMDICFSMPKDEFRALLLSLLERCDSDDTMIYFQLSRGIAARKHEYRDLEGALLIMITPFRMGDMRKKMKLASFEDKRFLYCDVKTINLIPSVLAAQHASLNGCGEALMHRGDIVTECAHSSLLMIKDGRVIAPPLDEYILPGITRKVVEEICVENGIPFEVRRFTVKEAFDADELIVASTTKNIAGVCEIDGKPVCGKDEALLSRLQDLFQERLERETR
jgi:D-alanine transaminase